MSSAKPADGGNPSLSTSFAWSLTGNMVYAASQVGVVAVLANLASPTTVGRYAFGLAIVTPVLLFAKLQLAPFWQPTFAGTTVFPTIWGFDC